MTIIANDIITTSWYTPKSEEGQSSPTRFKIKPLDGSKALEVRSDTTVNEDGQVLLTGHALNTSVKYGLVGWENFVDSDGNNIDYTPYAIDKLSASMLEELAGVIIGKTSFTGQARKNS